MALMLIFSQCGLDYETGGEDQEGTYYYYLNTVSIDYDGNYLRNVDNFRMQYPHMLEEKVMLTSDNSLLKYFESSNEFYSNEYRYKSNLNYTYSKTSYFDNHYLNNWIALYSQVDYHSRDLFDTRSPFEIGLIGELVSDSLSNPFRSESSKILFHRARIKKYEPSADSMTIKKFQSGFISATTYLDTTLHDLKWISDQKILTLLSVSEYRESLDSLQTSVNYAFVKEKVVLATLDFDGTINTVFDGLHRSSVESFYAHLRISDQYIMVYTNRTNYMIFNDSYELLEDYFYQSERYEPRLPLNDNRYVFQSDGKYYVSVPNETPQRLSEIVPASDSLISHATLHDNRFVIYLTYNDRRINLYDMSSKQLRFSLPIESSQLNLAQFAPRYFVPLIIPSKDEIYLIVD